MGRFAASGTERQLAGMLVAAARTGQWEPTLCVLRAGEPYAQEMAAAGIPLVEYDASDADPRRLTALRRTLTSGDYDVVHSSLYGANALTRLSLLGPSRPPVVVSERRVEDWRSRPARLVDRALKPVTDMWIGNSPDVADFVVRVHGAPRSRVHVIRNGIDERIFRPGSHPRPERSGPVRIGSVGRLIPVKGFDVLIEAARSLVPDLHVEFVVVGEGAEREALERQALGLPITFPGGLHDPAQVADFLRTLDVFVLPSRSEGLPNVVLEAAACGLPVVATRAPGIEGAAADAVLVDPDDAPALAAALRDQVLHPVPARPLGVQSFEAVARAHRDVYAAAAARRS
ncbi:glycosyltransferase [Modestobacter sp. DSM 44400]|uniref:glycosyltransferase n=1 Tax=Modestobacter sp. DSM 44400 TaxID=1550230 RepID=UPI000B84A6A6|nr:glycosyltransferase [Modestobacter sp. DSM 44400]